MYKKFRVTVMESVGILHHQRIINMDHARISFEKIRNSAKFGRPLFF